MTTGVKDVEPAFDAAFRERLNDLFRWRRDVRRFRRDAIAPELVEGLLERAFRLPLVRCKGRMKFGPSAFSVHTLCGR